MNIKLNNHGPPSLPFHRLETFASTAAAAPQLWQSRLAALPISVSGDASR